MQPQPTRVEKLERLYEALMRWKTDQRNLTWCPVEAALKDLERVQDEKGSE